MSGSAPFAFDESNEHRHWPEPPRRYQAWTVLLILLVLCVMTLAMTLAAH